jgi:hypothetical protein
MCPNEKINATFGQVRLCIGRLWISYHPHEHF